MNSIFPFFKWANETWLSEVINDSKWLFPAIEGVHIVALALLFGAVIVLNLRLLGIMMRDRPVPDLAREFAPWTLCSLVIILATGAMLFASEAVRVFRSTPFLIKMILLAAAIVFHYTVSRRIMNRDEGARHPVVAKGAAVIGLVLWLGVGFAGRAIGFF